MKMQNVLRSERDGVIKSIKVKVGDSVAVDEMLIEFEWAVTQSLSYAMPAVEEMKLVKWASADTACFLRQNYLIE